MRKIISLAAGAALLGAATLVPAASQDASTKGMHAGGKHDGASHQMKEHMQQGMQRMQSMPMSGDMDRDFAQMMKMHHEDGIKMAEMQLKNGKDPKMKEMARKTVEEQKKDIQAFERWLAQNRK